MKFNFTNNNNEMLAGNLELPQGKPKAFALFAHCFTCSKDLIASSIISRTLVNHGIAVLRFDFTGLGNSQGDFANTNFSSNVDDLIAACAALSEQYSAPQILIGHSLGGAAVLKAAPSLNSIKAVVTIAAPSCSSHVSHLFSQDIDAIKQNGAADIDLYGRTFTIKKQFIDDINETEILAGLKNFKKALLVMHSPTDNVVSVEHASKIFLTAKHPKSFISLDNIDHLLFNKQDAIYIANTIGTWVQRYIDSNLALSSSSTRPEIESESVLVKSRITEKFTQDIYTKDHHIVADEPLALTGNNLGLTPYELLLAGLGACTSMTVKLYAARKKINLSSIEVILKHKKIHAEDCQDCESKQAKIDTIYKSLSIKGEFSDEQERRMHEIAENCPVNKTLMSEIKIRNT